MPNALVKKLAIILGEVGKVEKTGRNTFHNYDYVTENDLVYAVRQKLSDAGIFVFTSTESQSVQIVTDPEKGKTTALTCVATKHTFVDGDSGEQFSVMSQGQGADIGDKGGYKAITGAMKYFIYKCFMIPTGDDPERDSPHETQQQHRAPEQRSYGGQSSAPAPRESKTTVPRDPDVGHELPPGMHWSKVIVHFGKNEGKRLGELDDRSIQWYAEKWTPKPYGSATDISRDDKMLLAGVAAWKADES